ncbi:UDP-N-acetylmuramate dehydrogenase [Desulfosudis oleivorans]|uniref:UDP-N-acetylenolpyruvoylglucosamine reductase n=1 Tax=Desulfosudis oleivorans (strain DSM 6200 / JCM 39069 / Hxd3) TaxID=96561 RepID=MURB_DESOH|nr:UDP-N-acetylmuramate dehydrogenase [Desulfosudis oleivorans]A8ZXW1.1 RecName: Full=UDP-N-acetylenolpyruvoylglucosamine reductase; AltName: Full=UDP-N-acetylmuramate dehydrogenase [Desulfosudis oleivorans Hxd3]ABW68588.1 UDP-N-acetylenolpyruvoylglucosamine reductase [Desulfosudis oleivorans Hxd3]
MDQGFRQWLTTVFRDRVKWDEPMSRHTTLGVGGPADALVAPETVSELRELIGRCRAQNIAFMVLAGGSNLLVRDRGIRGIVIDMKKYWQTIERHSDRGSGARLTVGAGLTLAALCRYAADNGLAGMTFAVGIPGTVGGAVAMNAGTAEGWMGDVVEAVEMVTGDGRRIRKEKQDLVFSYRRFAVRNDDTATPGPPVITGVDLGLGFDDSEALKAAAEERRRRRTATQPAGFRSAGCFFKNPEAGDPAGKLIDRAGLKGLAVGGAVVSEAHGNFLVNRGNATAGDLLALMETVQRRVADRFGVTLEPEVTIVGQ